MSKMKNVYKTKPLKLVHHRKLLKTELLNRILLRFCANMNKLAKQRKFRSKSTICLFFVRKKLCAFFMFRKLEWNPFLLYNAWDIFVVFLHNLLQLRIEKHCWDRFRWDVNESPCAWILIYGIEKNKFSDCEFSKKEVAGQSEEDMKHDTTMDSQDSENLAFIRRLGFEVRVWRNSWGCIIFLCPCHR